MASNRQYEPTDSSEKSFNSLLHLFDNKELILGPVLTMVYSASNGQVDMTAMSVKSPAMMFPVFCPYERNGECISLPPLKLFRTAARVAFNYDFGVRT